MTKTHFFVSIGEPVSDWSAPRAALCGARLNRPQPEMFHNLTDRGLPEFNALRDCHRCTKFAEMAGRDPESGAVLTSGPRYYLYGIREAELHQNEGSGTDD